MEKIKQAILNTLKVNLGHKQGESVAIVMQEFNSNFNEDFKILFEKSKKLCETMLEIYKNEGVDVELISYTPKIARNGVDADLNIGEFDIVFMPTVFSLSHTNFRKKLSEKGCRIASMPGFTLEMFEEKGPMDIDYKEIEKITNEIAEKLRKSKFIRITAKGTDITVEVDQSLVYASSGLIQDKDEWGNLPGAEAYCVPVHLGKSNGFFSVPAGWGGQKPLKHAVKFVIENGRFVDFIGENKEAQEYIDEEIKPLFVEENYDILAELGIGTNPNITNDYINKHNWTILTAEKVWSSAHFANGNSAGMGGKNDVEVHIDWIVPDVEIEYRYTPSS